MAVVNPCHPTVRYVCVCERVSECVCVATLRRLDRPDPAAAKQSQEQMAAAAKAQFKGMTLEEARLILNLKDPKEGIDPVDAFEVRLI